jgi:hypothetical protein
MAKYPYHVRVNEDKEIEEKAVGEDGAEVVTKRQIKVWRIVRKVESLNEARKLASDYGRLPHDDVRIERVNGKLIECAGKPA